MRDIVYVFKLAKMYIEGSEYILKMEYAFLFLRNISYNTYFLKYA